MPLLALLLLTTAAFASGNQVEVRDSEIWLVREGQQSQITRDRKPKDQAVLSPAGRQIAYLEGTGSIVVIDTEGRRIKSFQPAAESTSPSPCTSIVTIEWRSEKVIAAECHINPSLSEYVETEVATGRTVRDLMGYDFVPSPDGRTVAHVGWIPHFAPPSAHSNYLQFDRKTAYPLPPGTRAAGRDPPDVVKVSGRMHSGIHDFAGPPVWSPDSAKVAILDCTYDWTEPRPGEQSPGVESNRRCSLAVVPRQGEAQVFPISGIPRAAFTSAVLGWRGSGQVILRAGAIRKSYTVR